MKGIYKIILGTEVKALFISKGCSEGSSCVQTSKRQSALGLRMIGKQAGKKNLLRYLSNIGSNSALIVQWLCQSHLLNLGGNQKETPNGQGSGEATGKITKINQ
jgi:hypothetical protein